MYQKAKTIYNLEQKNTEIVHKLDALWQKTAAGDPT